MLPARRRAPPVRENERRRLVFHPGQGPDLPGAARDARAVQLGRCRTRARPRAGPFGGAALNRRAGGGRGSRAAALRWCRVWPLALLLLAGPVLAAVGDPSYVAFEAQAGALPLVAEGTAATLVVD